VKAIFEYWGRKGQAFFATVIALIIVGMADKQAAEAIGWCIVGAFGIFCGANSAVTIGTTKSKRFNPAKPLPGQPVEQEQPDQ
jgi:hypothetical protein